MTESGPCIDMYHILSAPDLRGHGGGAQGVHLLQAVVRQEARDSGDRPADGAEGEGVGGDDRRNTVPRGDSWPLCSYYSLMRLSKLY